MFNITGGKDLTLQEVNRVSEVVTSLADPNANIIFGCVEMGLNMFETCVTICVEFVEWLKKNLKHVLLIFFPFIESTSNPPPY